MRAPSASSARSHTAPPARLTAEKQRAILLAALFAGVVEVLGLVGGLPALTVGRIVWSPSVLPGLVVVWLLGRRVFGRSRSLEAATPFWIAAALGLGFGGFLLAREHHRIDTFSILVAAMNEEVIYRFSVPTVIAAILISAHVRVAPARIAGFLLAAVWFVMLPGHRAQMTDGTQVLPFLAFAALAAFIVYRSGSFAATAAAHTVMNILTILTFGGSITPVFRSLGIACLLILLVAAYALPPRQTTFAGPSGHESSSGDRRDDEVIDLRDGIIPTHTGTDGATTPLVEPAESDHA